MKIFAEKCTATDPGNKIAVRIKNLEPTMEPIADPKNGVLMELVSIAQILHMFKVNLSCALKDGEPAVTIILRNEKNFHCPF